MKMKKLFVLIFLTGACSLSLIGSDSDAQVTKVRISYSSRSNSVTPFQVAQQKGFFREEGLDAELIQVNPRLGAVAAMNGDIDITTTFGSTLRGILQGFPLKFAAVSIRKSDHFLIVRPDIRDFQELKGKKLGVSTLLGSDQRAAEEMMRAKGFNAAALKIVALGDSPVRMQALRAGIVEAVAVGAPQDLMLKDEGYRILAGPQDVEFALPTSGIAVTTRLLQEKPQLVKKVVRAMLKAHRFVFENKRETVPLMRNWLQQTAELAERSYDIVVLSLSRTGDITDNEWERLVEKKRPLDDVRDFSLLREAQKELKLR